MLKSGAFRIALIYVLISLLWIFLSDRILFLFKNNLSENAFMLLNSGKGFFFVLATGGLLFFLIRKNTREIVASEEGYRDLYNGNPNPMWIYDPTTLKFISVNDSAISLYGYSKEEFLNMTTKDIRPVEDHDRLIDAVKRTQFFQKAGGWRHLKKDGTIMFVDISSQRMNYLGIDAVMALMIDNSEIITHQEMLKTANSRLTDEKKRLSDIQELSKIAGWDYYVEDGKLSLSDEMYEVFNLDKAKINVDQASFLKTVHRDDLEGFLNAVHTSIKDGTDLDVVHRFFLGRNNIRYIRELGKLEYVDGKPYKIRGTMQDITELKLMQQERDRVYNENRKLDNIITKINNMVVLVDADSCITWVNKAYEKFTGNLLSDIKGFKPSVFMIGEHNQEILQNIDDAQARLESFEVDMVNYKKNRQAYWVNIEFTPMFENGVFVGYITVHNNITTRKEKEEEITKQNIILKDIAWLSSHEIRRPVASILGLMELINTNPSGEEKDQYINMMNECTMQLDEIIHRINNTINEKLPAP